jgi:hypothetical protein
VPKLPEVQPRLGKLHAASTLLVVRRRSPTQGVPRERKYTNMLQLSAGGRRKPQSPLSGLQTREGGDEKYVAEDTQDYIGEGVIFQPHNSSHVPRGGAPSKDRGQQQPRTNLVEGPDTNSKNQVNQFGPQI